MELGPGTAVTSELTLLRPIDSGAMGSVWIGRHARLGREVAVKFITAELRDKHPTALDRFRREAAVLKQVDSEHIVGSYGQGAMEDGTPYIVMELLSGKHLAQLLDERGTWLTLADVEALVEQMAEALSQIHQFDIVHRDIKAENVCVVRSVPLLVKLIDFGVSKVPDMPGSAVLTEPGTLVGSAEYMSPEQIVNAATVDHMADLWAMGVLVYLALLFELPFHGADLADVFTAIRRGQYRRPTLLRPELPPALDDFFARAFHPKRAERFLSATEMASAFNEAIGDALLSVPPPNRTRTYVLVALGALVLIAVFLAVMGR